MDSIIKDFEKAHLNGNGYLLASCITPAASTTNPGRLYEIAQSSTAQRIQADLRYATVYNSQIGFPKSEGQAWQDVLLAYWKAVVDLIHAEELTNQGTPHAQWSKVYDSWKEVVNALIRGYNNASFEAWTVPCLYTAGKYLRTFAIKADEQAAKAQGDSAFGNGFQDDLLDATEKNEKLEDAARQINRIFGLCISDRAPLENSRKWALYYTMNLLFKTYFKLNSVTLSKNILRSLQASTADMPPLSLFPKSHIVTYEYYVGVIHFLEETYVEAETHLTNALLMCHRSAQRNRELILTYLIPCHLVNTQTLPTKALLEPYPRLHQLFGPLASCIKRGDLAGFDAALTAGQEEFVKRKIYLTLERTREIALRNLFRKVFIAGGFEPAKGGDEAPARRTRLHINEFAAALSLAMGPDAETLDQDEVECLIANLIYSNRMKGYIARVQQMVVLNKKGAFPGTGV